jgi:hypothetical protein
MGGLIALSSGIAALAGLCAFLISYDEASHRFTRHQARREGIRAGLVAAAFFETLGALLIGLLFR